MSAVVVSLAEYAEPGSAAWFAAKVGKLGASRFADAVRKLKTKDEWAKSRHDLIIELVTERLTGAKVDGFVSREMLWGIENEPAAIALYEWQRDCIVEKCGFIPHPTIRNAGATPDGGLVGDDGIIEVKAPKSTTFVELRLEKEHGLVVKRSVASSDDDYLMQCMWQLACTGRKWCDLTYYDPRMPEGLQLYVRRIPRDEVVIAAMEKQASDFLAEVDALEAKLRLAA